MAWMERNNSLKSSDTFSFFLFVLVWTWTVIYAHVNHTWIYSKFKLIYFSLYMY